MGHWPLGAREVSMSEIRWVAEARESALPGLLQDLALAGNTLALERFLMSKLVLVVEELFLNTVNHGSINLSNQTVTLVLEVHPAHVRLVYQDHGVEYNPFVNLNRDVLHERDTDRRIGGLGVLLVEGLATDSIYQRIAGSNRIELRFSRLSPPPPMP
jgi:serine/threonine-protein kinase RsbW